jgi:heme/copper-type cytochrome/quinol oxidase subunit 2
VASLALLILAAAQALAQGCAMCYSSAAGAGEKSQLALNHAVLVLLVPAVTMLVGFVGIAFAYRREHND